MTAELVRQRWAGRAWETRVLKSSEDGNNEHHLTARKLSVITSIVYL